MSGVMESPAMSAADGRTIVHADDRIELRASQLEDVSAIMQEVSRERARATAHRPEGGVRIPVSRRLRMPERRRVDVLVTAVALVQIHVAEADAVARPVRRRVVFGELFVG